MLGVSTPTYSAWEAGQRDIPPMFAALEEVFGIDPRTVLFDRPTEPPVVPLNLKRLEQAYRMAGQAVNARGLRIPDGQFWELVGVAYDLGPGPDTAAALVDMVKLADLRVPMEHLFRN